jgi:hypothetical protein
MRRSLTRIRTSHVGRLRAPDPVSVTMPLSVDPVQRPGGVGTAMAR